MMYFNFLATVFYAIWEFAVYLLFILVISVKFCVILICSLPADAVYMFNLWLLCMYYSML